MHPFSGETLRVIFRERAGAQTVRARCAYEHTRDVKITRPEAFTVVLPLHRDASANMWNTADRIAKTFSDLTLGTVIVLIHATLADRRSERRLRAMQHSTPDGTRVWKTQISP